MVIAEASGRHEDEDLIPLHPKADAGSVFAKILRRCGVDRDSLTLTNSCWQRPPMNELDEQPYELEAVDYYRQFNEQLIAERTPKVIVLTGNVPLRAYSPYGRDEGQMITQMQNYAVPAKIAGVDTILLFALHPSFILHGQQSFTQVLIWDIQRAFQLAKTGIRPQPTAYVPTPCGDDFLAFERGFNSERHFLSFDIETPESPNLSEEEVEDKEEDISYQIIRASFCYDGERGHAISFPWQDPFITIAKRMLENAKRLEVWHRYFDVPRLKHAGVNFNGRIYDRMQSFRFLQPTLPASLGFATALLGWNLPPWKFLGSKEPELYSAIDAHALRFNGIQIEAALRARGSFDLHERHVVQCYEVLEMMSENGLPFDQPAAVAFGEKLEKMRVERETELQSRVPDVLKPTKQKTGYKKTPKDVTGLIRRKFIVAWEDLTKLEQEEVRKGALSLAGLDPSTMKHEVERWAKLEWFNPGSPVQKIALIRWGGFKPGTNRKTKKASADDETIRKIIRKCLESTKTKEQEFGVTLKMVREYGQLSKVLGTYVRGWKPGPDGRVHATPGFWGKMFRISWRRPNTSAVVADKTEDYIASGFRKCVKAAPGKLLWESDWKGIEAVLVGHLAGDKQYMRLAKIGVHDYFACHLLADRGKILQSDIPDLSLSDKELKAALKFVKKQFPKDRDDAKHTVHGSNYCMTALLLSMLYELPMEQAEKLLTLYFETFPKIKAWQESVKELAAKKVWLQNVWGYRMPFWEIYRWDAQRYERLLRTWRKPGSFNADGSKYNLSKIETEWVNKIQEAIQTRSCDVDEAISSLCWNLGDDAKSAVSFLPRDTAAGMLKEVLLRLKWLAEEKVMLLSTHDSILCETTESKFPEYADIVRREMEAPVPQLGGLIIGVECKYGQNWDSADDEDESSMHVYEFPKPVEPVPVLVTV